MAKDSTQTMETDDDLDTDCDPRGSSSVEAEFSSCSLIQADDGCKSSGIVQGVKNAIRSIFQAVGYVLMAALGLGLIYLSAAVHFRSPFTRRWMKYVRDGLRCSDLHPACDFVFIPAMVFLIGCFFISLAMNFFDLLKWRSDCDVYE